MPGESLVVIGGSGTGKSVMLKCILGIETPDSGQVLIDGAPSPRSTAAPSSATSACSSRAAPSSTA